MKDKKKVNLVVVFPFLILFTTLFISIGYAAINSITSEIKGNLAIKVQDGIFITDVILSSSGVDSNLSSIDNYYKTMLKSNVNLSTDDANSSVTYTITIYNRSNDCYAFSGVKYDSEFYSNPNIVFELNGLAEGDELPSKNSVTFTVTFHYLNYVIADNNNLESYLNFEFKKKYTISYVNVSNSDIINNNYPVTILDGNSLNLTFVGKISSLEITMGDKLLTSDVDYTFSDNILKIGSVNDNLVIKVESVVTPIDDGNGNYFGGSDPPGNNSTITEDGWTGDVYNLTFGIQAGIGTVKTYTYTVKIMNTTDYVWSNFNNTDKIIDTGGGWFGVALQGFSSSLSHQELNPGETLTITFTVKYRVNLDCSAAGQTIITFDSNGEEKTLELNIKFSMDS